MRIADIIVHYAETDSSLVDLTAPSSALSGYIQLPKPSTLPVVRSSADAPTRSALLFKELTLGDINGADNLRALLAQQDPFERAIFVVFADRPETFVAQGLVSEISESGFEALSIHVTDHKLFQCAVALASRELPPASLRAINEYRFTRDLLARREAEIESLREELDRFKDLEAQVKSLRAAMGKVNRERDQAKKQAEAQTKRADAVEKHLALTHKKMTAARGSVSFRIGRATKLAWKDSRKKPLALPNRWLEAFRERSEVPENLPPLRVPAQVSRHQAGGLEFEATARENLMLEMPGLVRQGLLIAGVSGRAMSAELGTSARYRSLTPNHWPYLLDADRPAFVLVTSDGLAAGSAWGATGTPDGRSISALLVALCRECSDKNIPIAFWDTDGGVRHRLGLPRGARFDAIFSVNPSHQGLSIDEESPGVEHLPPAVSLFTHSPIGLEQTIPTGALYSGTFDRRRDKAALAGLQAGLDAAIASSLTLHIRDPLHNYVGAGADAFAFPERFRSRASLSQAPHLEASQLRQLGVAICSQAGAEASWQTLRALAAGSHVLSTAAVDKKLSTEIYSSREEADEALRRLSESPRLGATWQASFATILERYTLQSRLETIARRVGSPRVTPPLPSMAMVGQVKTSGDLDSLRDFLAAQSTPPKSLHILADDDLDVASKLSDAIGPTRLSVTPASEPGGEFMRGDSATHLLCWHARLPRDNEAVEDLLSLARFSDSSIVGISSKHDDEQALFFYGQLRDDSIVAIRREATAGRGATAAANPLLVARSLVAEGAKLLTKTRNR